MEFCRQEYWSGLPFPSLGIFPTQGLNPGLSHCRQILYHLNNQGSLLSGMLTRTDWLLLLSCFSRVRLCVTP